MSSVAVKALPARAPTVAATPAYADVCTAGVLALVDALVVAIAFATSVLAWSGVRQDVEPGLYLSRWPVLFVFLAVYAAAGLYRGIGMNAVDELRLATVGTTLAFLSLATGAFLLKEGEAYSRAISLLAWMQVVVLLPVARGAVRRLCAHQHWWGRRVAVLGAGRTGELVVRALEQSPEFGLKPVAVLDDDPRKHRSIRGVPVFGGLERARAIVQEMSVRYGIVAMPGLPREKLLEIISIYGEIFPRLLVIPDLFGISSLWVEATDLGGVLGIELRQKLLLPWARTWKRFADLLLAVALGAAALPLVAAIAALIKLTSRGPVFYGQTRVGEGGRTFRAWKFRTMVEGADEVLREKLASDATLRAEWDRDRKLKSDPRVTAVGRLLRRTSLDELPQLWNVLEGRMSVVGPRPIVEQEIARYGAAFDLYCKVKPGISGLWQVSGRNNTTYEERMHCDEYYVRNWSLWLDLYILGKTVRTVVTGEGAY